VHFVPACAFRKQVPVSREESILYSLPFADLFRGDFFIFFVLDAGDTGVLAWSVYCFLDAADWHFRTSKQQV